MDITRTDKLPFFVRAAKNGIESFRWVFVLGLIFTTRLKQTFADATRMRKHFPDSVIHILSNLSENHLISSF